MCYNLLVGSGNLSKIRINAHLKSKDDNLTYNGYGIKNKNIIMYTNKNIMTKIIIDDVITLERKKDYLLKINLKEGINLEGEYITNYGTIKLETYAKEITRENNTLKLTYDLIINDEFIDTFTYNLEYSIDS